MTNWSQRRPKKQSLPRRTNLKPRSRHVGVCHSHVVLLTRTGVLNQRSHFAGKRKADAEADPKREKKRSREVSEPLEESEPEPGKAVPVPSVYPIYLLSMPSLTPPTPPFFFQRQPRSDVAPPRKQLPEYFRMSYLSSMTRYVSFETGASSMAQ